MAASSRRRNGVQEERIRQERLAYMGSLSAGFVHEVRTSLHPILLNIQMLSEDVGKLPPEMRPRFERCCRRVMAEVKTLVGTLDSFLAFTKPPKSDPVPIDVNNFLRGLMEFLKPELDDAGIRVESNLAKDMYPVVLDQAQFAHVIFNLVRNAREAIDARRDREAADIEGCIVVATAEEDEEIKVIVQDNGAGIDPADEERIFDAFFTTKPNGTGLGLGIVKRIVEDHRGSIAADPAPPPGARFVITLPRGRFLEFREEDREQ